MKRLLLLLPLLAVAGCNYQSMSEARQACKEWSFLSTSEMQRDCVLERDTRQVMGLERPARMVIRGGGFVGELEHEPWKILRRFRY